MVDRLGFCHSFATRGIEPLHRLPQSGDFRAQVRVGLTDIGAPEEVAHLVQGEASFVPTGTRFPPKIVEVQIDQTKLRGTQATTFPRPRPACVRAL